MAGMSSDKGFPIVGIGASAGGLEALEGLFRGVPADTGMAFILVTHMARSHESALPEIIARFTPLKVDEAEDGVAIRANHIYVCPADSILTVEDGRIRLTPRASEFQRKPIDVFLSSLAEDHGEAAVGIVLSGGGSDGALGIKGIKERGGFTLAQGPDGKGPQHPNMPETAIASGVVDLVLPAEQMGARLADYAVRFAMPPADAKKAVDGDSGYPAIYRILLNQVGHDFSGYKEKTFVRRVRRRMQVLQLTSLEDYVARLRHDPDQVSLLFRDLLIGVTNFFRDPEAFQSLAELVIPRLFENLEGETLRIWVPGCATGEEVYSIAIQIREHIDTLNNVPRIQIFATDIDEPALGVARAGRYPGPLLDSVSKERLARFFTGDDVSYVVNKDIRDMCIFSSHSVIRDPPFSRIDLISCRNLLIYLGTDFQAQVIPVFHFALKPRGYLFLGTSENVSQHADLFVPVDKRQRIFQRRDHAVSRLQFPLLRTRPRTPFGGMELPRETDGIANLRRAVDARVLDRFAPPHVVVNREGDIIHYSSRTGKYLEPAVGLPNRQLLAMARRGLRLDLRAALKEAVVTRHVTSRENIAVEVDDRVHIVGITVEPLNDDEKEPLFLILFRDAGPAFLVDESAQSAAARNSEQGQAHLEGELRDTRERLQSTIEEYETAVEELKSSNEELQSINEELQSTNEELESSKEELQSVNEELQTVNAELAAKVDEADRATSDLQNVFESTRVALVFLDRQLVIRSFTPAISSIFNLISTDKGRPLTDIVSNIDFPTGELQREIQTVVERGQPIEHNVRTTDGRTSYLMRILPYRRPNTLIEGVLIIFVDIDRVVKAEEQQRTLVEELNHRVRNMLTIVNAIATQTKTHSPSMDDFVQAFTGRIRAMGAAYGTVSAENWGEAPLRQVLASQLQSFVPEASNRIRLNGPPAYLQPGAALAFGMVVHELATNAVKHGALSTPSGHISVIWKEAEKGGEPVLSLKWIERGGPEAKRPARAGFGSGLIDRELKHALRAQHKFEFGANGFSARMFIPLEKDLLTIRSSGADE
jgi:two-component system CheB/CheR fusion protein